VLVRAPARAGRLAARASPLCRLLCWTGGQKSVSVL